MYNKIFTKILDSSIWMESDHTRIVWLTLLAAMDSDGVCQFASPANLAHRAIIPLDKTIDAIKKLEGPDVNSSDPENDGRRIERVPGGWIVLNAIKYREIVSRAVAQEKSRLRVAKFRDNKKHVTLGNADVTIGNEKKRSVTPSETETETETNTPIVPLQGTEEALAATKTVKGPLQLRAEALFNRRPETPLTNAEQRAFKKNAASIKATSEGDWKLLEAFYAAPQSETFARKDLAALVNNWNGEIDKARAWSHGAAKPERYEAPLKYV